MKYNPKYSHTGFSLTEMLIVIAIFILVILAVYSVYNLSQQAYLTGEKLAEITQNGRVVLERISREIRQAKEIVTELPEERIDAPNEIKFQDGHISLVFEEDTAQGASINAITLASDASDEDDYYKDVFVKIISGVGAGQTRKIYKYNGTTKVADIEGSWDTTPISGSSYKIDSSFHYIYYYQDENNNIYRKVSTYCFSEDSITCIAPETYVPWNAIPPIGQTLLEITLEAPRIIGEYVSNLEFWGFRVINISLTLEKKNKTIDLETKILGRNL